MEKDIFKFTDELLQKLKDLAQTETCDSLNSTSKVLSHVRSLLSELKAFVTSYTFENIQEEIRFFKETKPIFSSQYFYYKQLLSIQLFNAFRDEKSIIDHYQKVLRKLERFIKKHEEFYKYCISGESYLDSHYFCRNNSHPISIDHNELFTTSFDTRLAKILAAEMIRGLVKDNIDKIRNQNSQTVQSALSWTGSKTDLIELIYALHDTGVFNNATADIRKIVETFEAVFNVSLTNYYRMFLGIRIRKVGQTTFLDHLKDRLIQRLNEQQ